MTFTRPTKNEVKQKYGISEDDFEILVQDNLPAAKELQEEGTVFERVASWLGVPTFLKKYRKTGILIALVLIPGWGPMVCEKGNTVITTSYNFYAENVNRLQNFYDENSKYLVFYPDGEKDDEKKELNFGDMPIASGVTGISATDIKYFS